MPSPVPIVIRFAKMFVFKCIISQLGTPNGNQGTHKQQRSAVSVLYTASFQNGVKPLDLTRFEELYADFYLSSDESTPGKYICGAVNYTNDDSK